MNFRKCCALSSKCFSALCVLVAILLVIPAVSACAFEASAITSLSLDTGDSSPSDFRQAGETLFFRANDGIHGSELWKTDSADARPVMVADLNPGGSSNPMGLEVFGDRLLFVANDGENGYSLWKSDGTREGTVRVNAITTSPGIYVHSSAVAGDRAFFMVEDVQRDVWLWVSDGTENGTFPLNGSSLALSDRELCVVGEKVYFVADDGEHGSELWRSDGTVDGTAMVADLSATGDSYPRMLTASGAFLAFWAYDGESGYQVYRLSDGSPDPVRVTAFGNIRRESLFAAPDGGFYIHGQEDPTVFELLRLNSSDISADLVASLDMSGVDDYVAESGWNLDGDFLFSLMKVIENPGTENRDFVTDLMCFDLETGNTASIRTFEDTAWVDINMEILQDESLYFLVGDMLWQKTALWKTDGSPEGTVAVTDQEEGSCVRLFSSYGEGLALAVYDPVHGVELWRSDGTSEGTRLHADINRCVRNGFYSWEDRFYFGARTEEDVAALWESDGTATGTKPVCETPPAVVEGPGHFTGCDGGIFFFSGTNGESIRLWHSDGRGDGTREVIEVGPFVDNWNAAMQELNGEHYFLRQRTEYMDIGLVPQLWKTDGTSEGTSLVTDPAAGSAARSFNLVRSGQTLFFDVMNFDARESRLWVSDGTPEGTGPIDVPFPLSYLYFLVPAKSGEVQFIVRDSGENREWSLWKSDGTVDGTLRVILLGAYDEIEVGNLVPSGEKVFFRIYRKTTEEIELWVTEGTEETTHRVADLNPGGRDMVSNPIVFGEGIAFVSDDGVHGMELWFSDGTAEGTAMVADIDPEGHSNPMNLEVLDGKLFFSADDGVNGRELWTSDGTEDGTVMVCDAYSGDSNPQNPLLYRDELFFTAVDPQGEINLMKVVTGGSSGCNGPGLSGLAVCLLPLLVLFRR